MTNNLVRKIIAPVIAVVTLMVAIAIYSFKVVNEKNLYSQTRFILKQGERIFTESAKSDLRILDLALLCIKKNKTIEKAWSNRNKTQLLHLASPLFALLKEKYDITHLYFIGNNKKVFLRVHNPGVSGDSIQRETLDMAYKTNKPSAGLEYGIHHNFTLRNVYPWFVNGERVGFIEVGKEIANMTANIAGMLNVEVFFIFNKSLYSKEKWEEGVRLYGHDTAWDILENSIVLAKSMPDIPRSLEGRLNNHHAPKDYIFEAKVGNKIYAGGYVSVQNVSRKVVARMIIMHDVTDNKNDLSALIFFLIAGSAIGAMLLFILFHAYVKRINGKLIKAEKRLIDACNMDALTGIPNRRYFYSAACQIPPANYKKIFLMLLDIDDFKSVNDRHGHDAGDAVLKAFSQAVMNNLRQDDLFARFGGEEFILLFASNNAEEAINKGNQLIKAVNSIKVPLDGGELCICVSIGISQYDTEKDRLDESIKRADRALYLAKNNGKNCVRWGDVPGSASTPPRGAGLRP